MKKISCFLSFAFLVLSSCSNSEDTPVASSDPNLVLVKKIINTSTQGTITTNVVYNGNKIVSQSSNDSQGKTMYVTYTGDLITKIIYKIADGTITQSEIYTYDASNRLSTFIINGFQDNWGDKEIYTYNSDGSISVSRYTGDTTTQTQFNNANKIYFLNGEVNKIERSSTVGGPVTSTTTYAYDTKNCVSKNILGLNKINFCNEHVSDGIAHNVISITKTGSPTVNIQYTYNTLDYPITSTNGTASKQYFY